MGTVPKSARPQPKGGSRKGIPNKATRELKELILGALDEAGGMEYLVERAHDPRTAAAFLSLVGKVLPTTLAGEVLVKTLADELAALNAHASARSGA